MDFLKLNEKVWDENARENNTWSKPVSSEEIEKARHNEWEIVLTPQKTVPKEWFPEEMKGKDVLCLASGGGQQGPIIAALGSNVTVFDNSQEQLNKDILVANREGLQITTIQGDMRDLSKFDDKSFDLIIHPWSNCFIDDVIPVWEESYRVLRHGGVLISGFANPIEYIFDLKSLSDGEFVVRHKIPYSDLTSISEDEFLDLVVEQGEGIVFGHTLEDQIGGQIKSGFLIAGFYEDIGGTELDNYISSSIATKAIKL